MTKIINPNLKQSVYVNITLYVRLLLGLYTNLSTSEIINRFLKLYCAGVTIISFYFYYDLVFYLHQNRYFLFFTFFYNGLYFIIASILYLLSDGENIIEFLKSINSLDIKNSLRHKKNEFLITFIIFIGIIVKNIIRYVYLFLNYRQVKNSLIIISSLSWVEQELTHFTRIMMFECIWCKLTSLRKEIRECLESESDLYDENSKKKKVLELMHVYDKILLTQKYAGNITKFFVSFKLIYKMLFLIIIIESRTVVAKRYSVCL